MTITISRSDYNALWQPANAVPTACEGLFETEQLIPEQLGRGHIQRIHWNGINLYLFNYQFFEDVFLIEEAQNATNICREFGFNLAGNRGGKHTGQNFVHWGSYGDSKNRTRITYANDPILKIDIHLEAADELVQLVSEMLEELSPETRQRLVQFDNSQSGETDQITPVMRLALQQIFHCPFQGKMKQIYLESKCLELIVLKLEQLKERDQRIKCSALLKPDDIDRIQRAQTILVTHMENPPSLLELARQVGLNDCTLKRGFRQVFGTTAFGYLHDHRLEHACKLLLEHRLNVSEISRAIGFRSCSYFSKAFRKKYGFSPKRYQALYKNSV